MFALLCRVLYALNLFTITHLVAELTQSKGHLGASLVCDLMHSMTGLTPTNSCAVCLPPCKAAPASSVGRIMCATCRGSTHCLSAQMRLIYAPMQPLAHGSPGGSWKCTALLLEQGHRALLHVKHKSKAHLLLVMANASVQANPV